MPATDHGRLRKMSIAHHSVDWNVISHVTSHSKETCGEQLQTANRSGSIALLAPTGDKYEESPPRRAKILE